jgi:hypothetical protein
MGKKIPHCPFPLWFGLYLLKYLTDFSVLYTRIVCSFSYYSHWHYLEQIKIKFNIYITICLILNSYLFTFPLISVECKWRLAAFSTVNWNNVILHYIDSMTNMVSLALQTISVVYVIINKAKVLLPRALVILTNFGYSV